MTDSDFIAAAVELVDLRSVAAFADLEASGARDFATICSVNRQHEGDLHTTLALLLGFATWFPLKKDCPHLRSALAALAIRGTLLKPIERN